MVAEARFEARKVAGAEFSPPVHVAGKANKERNAGPARLEAQADAILARDAQLMQELGQHVQALESCYRELLAPRNDPEYLRTLESHEADRAAIANVTATVHHVVDGGKSWLSVGLTNPRNHAAASEAARQLGRHLEAPLLRHEDPKEIRMADLTQIRPPKHSFGREKRSLGKGR